MGEADDYDRVRRRVLWSMPSGLYIVGSRSGERCNAMTLNWATQVASEPKLLAIGVLKTSFTHELISEGQVFSLNTIARDSRALVRKFVKPATWDEQTQTLNEIPVHSGRTGAPILDEAVAFLDCEVRQAVDLGDHTLFVGMIVDAGFLAAEVTPVLRMEDTRMNYGG